MSAQLQTFVGTTVVRPAQLFSRYESLANSVRTEFARAGVAQTCVELPGTWCDQINRGLTPGTKFVPAHGPGRSNETLAPCC